MSATAGRAVPSRELVAPVLAGKISAVARLLTRAESGADEVLEALEEIYRHAGNAHVVGITGVPGSGKSTLLAKLAIHLRELGRRVGIVAVDPTSPFSGGSILGDRIRMNELSADPDIFIRSMATRGSLGGLARATLDAVDIMDAAGYDPVLIETVGVGQDEVEVVQAAQSTVVVSAPGLGDDIQAVKAGVLEIADIHVVSKCDRPDANRTITDLKGMLTLGAHASAEGRSASAWALPVVATSAESGQGIEELVEKIDGHRGFLKETGALLKRQRQIAQRRLLKAAEDLLRDEFIRRQKGDMAQIISDMVDREVHPSAAARQLIERVRKESD